MTTFGAADAGLITPRAVTNMHLSEPPTLLLAMSDNDRPDEGQITVARDYHTDTVVVETGTRTERLSPTAARQFATIIREGGKLPMSPLSGVAPLADELESAAADVEDET